MGSEPLVNRLYDFDAVLFVVFFSTSRQRLPDARLEEKSIGIKPELLTRLA